MSHYEKIAIVALRIIGCCLAVIGLTCLIYSLSLNVFKHEAVGAYFYSSLIYLLIGLVLYALSRPLAALIARKL